MKQKKTLYERLKKVRCQTMLAREKNDLFCKLPLELDWYRMEMYEKIIEELLKEGLIKEEIENTPDYKLIKMELLVIEPEEPEDE
jgi:hypothetical protein